jgi:hypothetical protein
MSIGRGVIVAAMTVATVMGITLPAYAAVSGGQAPAAHHPSRTECEKGGGTVQALPPLAAFCVGGKHNGERIK